MRRSETVIGARESALVLRNVSKRFGGVTVLDHVSLDVRGATVHALLGENGAGKTTLMRIAFGMIQPEQGTVHVHGRAVRLPTPAAAIAAGVGMVHQHFTLVPAMSVAENLALGGRGPLKAQALAATVRDVARATGFALDPSAVVETLPVGAQQRVEIAKAVVHKANVLILDEPTAVLAPAETADLLRWIRQFADDGNAVVLITHKLTEALAVADDVTVLRQGRVVHTGPATASSARSLTAAMLGRETLDANPVGAPRSDERPGPIVLRAERVTLRDSQDRVRLRDASLSVRGGEIVGIVGVEGAGHRELIRALAGRTITTSGSIERPGVLGFVPEDRHRDAVLLGRSLIDNVALRDAGRRRGRIRWGAIRLHTESLMRQFDVRAPSPDVAVRTLSGGNQQKLVLAREMVEWRTESRSGSSHLSGHEPSASALVIENPTRGLDVRATTDVHARLREARGRGTAIVIYSSDMDEILALSSRVFVAFAGTLREVAADRDTVGRAMLGLQ
ncbi:MAG: ABC transporter ATP-binding protein [Gemmatimonadales bacterium]